MFVFVSIQWCVRPVLGRYVNSRLEDWSQKCINFWYCHHISRYILYASAGFSTIRQREFWTRNVGLFLCVSKSVVLVLRCTCGDLIFVAVCEVFNEDTWRQLFLYGKLTHLFFSVLLPMESHAFFEGWQLSFDMFCICQLSYGMEWHKDDAKIDKKNLGCGQISHDDHDWSCKGVCIVPGITQGRGQ